LTQWLKVTSLIFNAYRKPQLCSTTCIGCKSYWNFTKCKFYWSKLWTIHHKPVDR